MITEVSIRCQKTPEVGIRRIPAYTPQYTTYRIVVAYDRVVHCRNRRYSSGGATVVYFVLVGVWLSFTPLIAQVHIMKIYCAISVPTSISVLYLTAAKLGLLIAHAPSNTVMKSQNAF